MKLIGREKERKLFAQYRKSESPEFVAVYGRRRVGKTFLINETFSEEYAFSAIGTYNADKTEQLASFYAALKKYGDRAKTPPENWQDAFDRLVFILEKSRKPGKKIIFLDELPWFDTRKSGFMSAMERFWNGWAAFRTDVLLIVCGSATSWMIGNLIRNRGGLHNRVTRRMRIEPFTLAETEEYLACKNILWERREIAEAYMIFGGIPFYLSQLQPGTSLAQNVDALCFEKDAFMRDEFFILFVSLFRNSENHIKVLEALGSGSAGMLRDDILAAAGLLSGGASSAILEELEQCGFIGKYNDYSGKHGRFVYQLTDFFTRFYLTQMKGNRQLGTGYWAKSIGKGRYNNWIGRTFEKLCLTHIDKIRTKLGISGIVAVSFAWKSGKTRKGEKGAQIDLLIDRNDGVINICECKFVNGEYAIDGKSAGELRERMNAFARATGTKKARHLTMITTYGVRQNKYSGMAQSEVTLDDLF